MDIDADNRQTAEDIVGLKMLTKGSGAL